jgi:hypothetical protein
MPNHVHGLIQLAVPDALPLSEIVRGFKTFSARRINIMRNSSGSPVWQRGYWEHIVRNESSLAKIREYIRNNPSRWGFDRENPSGKVDALERAFWSGFAPRGDVQRTWQAGLKPAPTEVDLTKGTLNDNHG